MPITIRTLDDFIQEHGGNAVKAIDVDGRWEGRGAGRPVCQGQMYLLPDGSWYRYHDDGSNSWQVPSAESRRKWQEAYMESKLFHLNEQFRQFQQYIRGRINSGFQVTKQEEKQLRRMKFFGDILKRQLTEMRTVVPTPRPPPPTAGELARQERLTAAHERINQIVGTPSAPDEVKLDSAELALLKMMGIKVQF